MRGFWNISKEEIMKDKCLLTMGEMRGYDREHRIKKEVKNVLHI